MKNSYVTDTMALILRLEQRKLSHQIKNIFQEAEGGYSEIFIPAMVFAEIGYLAEKRKIETNLNEVTAYCHKYRNFIIQPINETVIEKTFEISDIPELHDRIIAATACMLRLPLITNDSVISKSKYLSAIW